METWSGLGCSGNETRTYSCEFVCDFFEGPRGHGFVKITLGIEIHVMPRIRKHFVLQDHICYSDAYSWIVESKGWIRGTPVQLSLCMPSVCEPGRIISTWRYRVVTITVLLSKYGLANSS